MKQIISTYKKHKITVDRYLKNFTKSLKGDFLERPEVVFKKNRYVQLFYAVDQDYKQITPIIYRKKSEEINVGVDKSHYFQKMVLDEDNVYISNPYIHYRTGKASLSVVYHHDKKYYVFDIDLIEILEELRLIEFNHFHDKFKRGVYFFGSMVLTLLAIVCIGYGAYIFGSIMVMKDDWDLLHDIFKSIIAVTLGLAIFDLAKQIFEHEVLFRTFQHSEDKEYKVLGKFLISIIIALSIETLLVVFKIALSDNPANMLNAFYLIVGVAIMFVGLGWFYKTIKQSGCGDEE